ncbi:MAG: carbon starvation protein A [Spirochaetales bacterium]|nr:carbon starvation protein A [Spirochaetales bacterium]
MVTFAICITVLVIGYILYGRFTEKVFGPDDRTTPAVEINDGTDFVPMKEWRIFLIQLLNIAGLGPIFGALNGALFGPVVYIWIVLGTILAGGVHDYMSGMISMRNRGSSVSELTGKYLGKTMLQIMRIFSVVLLVMIGVVFSKGPAGLLDMLTPASGDEPIWLYLIIAYYFIATFLPVDKIIGKAYPVFGIALLVMALGVGCVIFFSPSYTMPEFWDGMANTHPQGIPVWPFLFITVACGAISGFHSTQSPIMARCCTSERQGRRIFYGAMVAEGIIAMVWAAAGMSFYEDAQALLAAGAGVNAVVFEICRTTLGKAGSFLAMLGVIACPITSGDTAYRSARLTLADWIGLDQKSMRNRLILTVPLLAVGTLICQIDYAVVWRYFSWSNQTLAMIMLWTAAAYLRKEGRNHLICTIPAIFMSAVTSTYFLVAPECLGMLWSRLGIGSQTYYPIAYAAGAVFAAVCLLLFVSIGKRNGMKKTT